MVTPITHVITIHSRGDGEAKGLSFLKDGMWQETWEVTDLYRLVW